MIIFLARSAAEVAAVQPGFNPDGAVTRVQALLLALIVVALFVVTLVSLFGSARQGNIKKTTNITAATLIALFPLAIAGVGVVFFAGSFFGWFS